MIKYLVPALTLALSGAAFAGPLESLKSSGFGQPAAAAAPAVSAPLNLTEKRGVSEGSFCFERQKNSQAEDARLPLSFCISKVALERSADGGMRLSVASDNKEMAGGKAQYVFVNGSMKYASAEVFEFFNEIYWGVIEVRVPVYANGNVIPGAEVKVAARAGLNPPSGDWLWETVEYSKPKPVQPPAVSGACFMRTPQDWADEAGMPARFCAKTFSLVREDNGGLKLALQGEISGSFGAEYVQVGGKTFLKAVIFDRETGGMSPYSGTVTLLLPVQPNGDLAVKAQAQVEAQAGYNWDIYHSEFQYQPVKYYAVAE